MKMNPTTLHIQFKNKNAVLKELDISIYEYEMLIQGLRSLTKNAREIYDTLMNSSFAHFGNEYQKYLDEIQELYDKLEVWPHQVMT